MEKTDNKDSVEFNEAEPLTEELDAFEDLTAEFQSPREPAGEPASPKKRINWHLILIVIILIIAGISIYKLLKWNQGTASDYDPNEVTTEFDVEALDMIIPMDADLLEGRPDDGVTTILCLGNAPFADETGPDGLAAQIAEKAGAVVYNGAFPGSAVACKYPVYNPDYIRDHFNLYYVTQAIINQEFTALASVAQSEDNPVFAEAVENLSRVDMDKVDILIIMYDTTDYNILTPSDDPNNTHNVVAYTGALRTSIENMQAAFPFIRIFVMSHTYARYLDENGKMENGTITDLGNGNVPHYLIMAAHTAMDCSVSFIDNYFGTINEDNYEEYMTDHMHYNDAGRALLAERFADIINKDKEKGSAEK